MARVTLTQQVEALRKEITNLRKRVAKLERDAKKEGIDLIGFEVEAVDEFDEDASEYRKGTR